jgi:hypothetical protein
MLVTTWLFQVWKAVYGGAGEVVYEVYRPTVIYRMEALLVAKQNVNWMK